MDAPIDVITVGNYTYGELNVHWYGSPQERLEIGNYCSIAGNVHFILCTTCADGLQLLIQYI